jgi:hypothetical protein
MGWKSVWFSQCRNYFRCCGFIPDMHLPYITTSANAAQLLAIRNIHIQQGPKWHVMRTLFGGAQTGCGQACCVDNEGGCRD